MSRTLPFFRLQDLFNAVSAPRPLCQRVLVLPLWTTFSLCLLSCLASCSEQPEAYEHQYTVRGKVVSLPDTSASSGDSGGGDSGVAGAGAFMVHHEAIPEYVSINGERGMGVMVMEFAVPDPAVLQGLSEGDIVEITYGETFRPRVRQGVIAVERLPADTELELGN